MITQAPEVPRLVHAWLSQQVQGKHELALRSKDLAELVHTIKSVQRRTVAAVFGSGLLIVAAILYGLEAGGPRLLRSDEHTCELQSLMRISTAVFCMKKHKNTKHY